MFYNMFVNREIKTLLKEIFKGLGKNEKLSQIINKVNFGYLWNFHFTIGTYLRNKYLWHNEYNYNLLKTFYKIDDIDDISMSLLFYYYFLYISNINL